MTSYLRPTCLHDALGHLASGDMRVAAGCTDLFPTTDRPHLPGAILDVTAIDGLRGITRATGIWRIGATSSWSDVITADLPPAFDMLKQAAAEVGSVQIQNAGTVAGNLCNASPAADGVPCLLALDASVRLASTRGERVLPLSEFLLGPRQTALAPDELMIAIELPEACCTGQSRFLKLGARAYLVISITMVAVRITLKQGHISGIAISVGACSGVAQRLIAVEQTLIGQQITETLPDMIDAATVAAALAPIDDIRADAAYRTHAATELLRRALRDVLHTAEVAA